MLSLTSKPAIMIVLNVETIGDNQVFINIDKNINNKK